ncbi:MAG: helix-turn-helix transcriptional regulator [Lachnospiraceae bacterium]|nr:helix-turn-helix transcriptional regulator [Lachnospiraceae bacterium]
MITHEAGSKTDLQAVSYLQVNSCGYEDIRDFAYAVVRSKGRNDYHLLYVQNGAMELEIAGEMKVLCPGECAFYKRGDKQHYIVPEEKDSLIYWIHFTGTSVEEVLASLGLTESGIIRVNARSQFESIFYQIIRTKMLSRATHIQEENALLLQLLTQLFLSCQEKETGSFSEIYTMAEYICDHFTEKLDFTALSSDLHLSRSRFGHLFTEVIGCSPSAYQQKLRLDKAKDYLLHSNMSIKECAHAVGYEDPLYFSRLFGRKYGMSPSKLRETYRDT